MRLPEELLARVDERAGVLGQTRTMFVERALETALGADAHGAPRAAPAQSRAPKQPPSLAQTWRGPKK